MLDYIDFEDIGVIATALTVSSILTWVAHNNPETQKYTQIIAGYEGNIIPLFQNTFQHPLLTEFFMGIYMFAYPLLLLTTYFYLKRRDKHMDFVKSYVTIQLFALPFFYFLPVTVTGYTLEAVEPLLYGHSQLTHNFFNAIEDYQKCLPSLHTGFSAVAMFSLYDHSKKAGVVGGIMTSMVIFSTFYLGIHWMTDAILGSILAYISYKIFHR